MKRLCSIDSRRWIRFIIDVLEGIEVQSFSKDNPRNVPTVMGIKSETNGRDNPRVVLNGNETRMLLMFHYTIWQKSVKDAGFKDVTESIISLKNNPVMFNELIELLKYRYEKIDFLDEEVDLGFDCPLDLHCSYTRDQILSAVDFIQRKRCLQCAKV